MKTLNRILHQIHHAKKFRIYKKNVERYGKWMERMSQK